MNPRIVLIGAGSAMFGLGALGDIFKCKALEGSTVVLHDINPQALEKVEAIARQYLREKALPYSLFATTLRQEALQGASFCIISIEVGDRYELWEQDWKIPLQYGIRQVYGENGGPGGLFHSLRIIPPILDICGDIQAICPDAYVINLSNPMIRISHAVHTKYPNLKYVGLCHEVASLIEHLPILLGTPFTNLSIKAGGFNHFSILVEASYKDTGEDAYPDIRAKGPAYFTEAQAYYDNTRERGLFVEILNRFGYLPITTDSHFGEYIHWAYTVVDHNGILEFYDRYKKAMLAPQDPPLTRIANGTSEREYWRVVPIIAGILTDSHHEELAVNIPNDGFIEYLPKNQVVEVPAIIDKDGIHGVKLDAYPQAFAGLLLNQVAVNDLTTEAILTGSKEIVMQALLVDPIVNNVRAAEEMLDTMLMLQKPYLGSIK
ncbi:MAG: alpha-glucosidase [Chloroflexi bacterium]|nr:alpha-glucosidase [Chloroflexota bacterium]MBU1660326.1 alpha-glucosidase [Chloroflexota bacterium]